MTTSKKRKAVTVQLVPGVDDDLIAWRESLPGQTRNQTTKHLLRRALDLPEPTIQADALGDDLHTSVEALRVENAKLWRQVENLRGMLANVPKLIQAARADAPATDAGESAIDALREDVRVSFDNMAQDIRELFEGLAAVHEAIATGGVSAATPATPGEEIQDAPRLSDQELTQREKKLNKATW